MSQYQCDSTTQRKVWFREGVVGELLESQLPLWTWSLTSVLTNIYVGPRKVRKIIFGICFLMLVLLVSYALMWVIIYNHLRRLFVGSTTSQRNRSKPNAAALQKAELEEEEENYDDDDEYEQLMTINNNRHFNNQLIKLENEKPNLLSSIPIPTLSEDYHQASSSSSSLSISDSNEEILNGDEADDVPNLFQDAKNNASCSAATNNFTQSHSSPSMMYSY
ncbi:hypothetical protein T4D_3836 [Trichinella pseudospiralis]|uniref:Uncharacterized protein n=1 Tax=Trichinella pseudospiralis TaxID=6337 RepID=A0A0V1FBS7_TRIPS|nr:hypothetical protein T4D_3836 [Trichinella pseudospiralis]